MDKNNTKIELDSIEDAIAAIRNGEMILVVDDLNRENEGDIICASDCATPEIINFMAKEGRGLICVSLDEKRCKELQLDMMVGQNTATHATAFTVSVDLLGHGCTTGISASDRSKTIKALVNPTTQPGDLGRPGHIFPLKAVKDGVLRRTGHTEAAMDFAKLAGFTASGVLCEVMSESGEMARLPELRVFANQHGLKLVSIEDLIEYRLKSESLIKREIAVDMPTSFGHFNLFAYKNIQTGDTHLALCKGEWQETDPVMVRVHSSCVTGDIFGSCRCDCGGQLHAAMRQVEAAGQGVVLYMFQEGRGIGLINKLKAYKLQEQGFDTVEANIELGFKADERDYGVGAQILRDLGVRKIRLLSNNPKKRAALMGYGLEIVETLAIQMVANKHNSDYLKTKRDKLGHNLNL
jgi:3,4-dihydroxy 2-butanone 4-phosphate synthase / GTP cyclohydrolase II